MKYSTVFLFVCFATIALGIVELTTHGKTAKPNPTEKVRVGVTELVPITKRMTIYWIPDNPLNIEDVRIYITGNVGGIRPLHYRCKKSPENPNTATFREAQNGSFVCDLEVPVNLNVEVIDGSWLEKRPTNDSYLFTEFGEVESGKTASGEPFTVYEIS